MIVLDASAAVEWLLHSAVGRRVDSRMLLDPDGLTAPHLIDLEITQALRREVRARNLSANRAEIALYDLATTACVRYPHHSLIPRIWELRDNISPYDAAYIALAEVLDAVLITCDAKLAAAPGHRARVELIS